MTFRTTKLGCAIKIARADITALARCVGAMKRAMAAGLEYLEKVALADRKNRQVSVTPCAAQASMESALSAGPIQRSVMVVGSVHLQMYLARLYCNVA